MHPSRSAGLRPHGSDSTWEVLLAAEQIEEGHFEFVALQLLNFQRRGGRDAIVQQLDFGIEAAKPRHAG